jgi:hypothetical protein
VERLTGRTIFRLDTFKTEDFGLTGMKIQPVKIQPVAPDTPTGGATNVTPGGP